MIFLLDPDMFPSTNLAQEDIVNICNAAKSAMIQTDHVCNSTSKQEIQTHRSVLSQAESGVESLVNHLVKEINGLKNSLSAVKAMGHDLKRHEDRCKNQYFLLRDSEQNI